MIAIYARQSVEKRDSISIEGQIEACQAEVKEVEYQVYEDRGCSGKTINRPAFTRLLEDIKIGMIQSVLVYKLDRISRSILDFSNLMEFFDAHQVSFLSMTEKFDTSAPIGRAMLSLCAVFAQLERETIQQRVEDAYWARSEKGFYMGGRIPYGFQKMPFQKDGIHTSCYQSVSEEAEQIQQLYSLYAKGNSLSEIERIFREKGIRKLRGSNWNPSRMSEILKNPIYVAADYSVYRYFKESGTLINNQPEEFCGIFGCYRYHRKDGRMELVLAPHRGIINASVWLCCQKRFTQKIFACTEKQKASSWLIGRVHCGNCGYALVVRYAKTKWRRYFVCSKKGRGCESGTTTVYTGALEEYLEEKIGRILEFWEDRFCNSKQERLEELEYKATLVQTERQIAELIEHQTDFAPQTLYYINRRISELDTLKRKLIQNHQEKIQNQSFKKKKVLLSLWKNSNLQQKQQIASLLLRDIQIADGIASVSWRVCDTTLFTIRGSTSHSARSLEF